MAFLNIVSLWIREFIVGELLYDIFQGFVYVFCFNDPELSGFFILATAVSLFCVILKLTRNFIFH